MFKIGDKVRVRPGLVIFPDIRWGTGVIVRENADDDQYMWGVNFEGIVYDLDSDEIVPQEDPNELLKEIL